MVGRMPHGGHSRVSLWTPTPNLSPQRQRYIHHHLFDAVAWQPQPRDAHLRCEHGCLLAIHADLHIGRRRQAGTEVSCDWARDSVGINPCLAKPHVLTMAPAAAAAASRSLTCRACAYAAGRVSSCAYSSGVQVAAEASCAHGGASPGL